MASWDFWWQGQSTNSEDVVLSHLLTMTRAQLDNGHKSTQQQQGVLLLLTVRIAKIGLNYFQLTFWYCKGYRLGHTWQSPSCKNYPAHPLTLDVVLASRSRPNIVKIRTSFRFNQSSESVCDCGRFHVTILETDPSSQTFQYISPRHSMLRDNRTKRHEGNFVGF